MELHGKEDPIMGKLSELPPLLSMHLGQPESLMLQYCRRIREAGHVSTGPRGPGGMPLNNGDVARILIGILGLPNAKDASDRMQQFLKLQPAPARPHDMMEREPYDILLSYFTPLADLESAITSLLGLFQSPLAMGVWNELTRPKATLQIDQVSVTARLKLVADAEGLGNELASTLFVPASPPFPAPADAPDLKITKTISHRTFKALADFVLD